MWGWGNPPPTFTGLGVIGGRLNFTLPPISWIILPIISTGLLPLTFRLWFSSLLEATSVTFCLIADGANDSDDLAEGSFELLSLFNDLLVDCLFTSTGNEDDDDSGGGTFVVVVDVDTVDGRLDDDDWFSVDDKGNGEDEDDDKDENGVDLTSDEFWFTEVTFVDTISAVLPSRLPVDSTASNCHESRGFRDKWTIKIN